MAATALQLWGVNITQEKADKIIAKAKQWALLHGNSFSFIYTVFNYQKTVSVPVSYSSNLLLTRFSNGKIWLLTWGTSSGRQ